MERLVNVERNFFVSVVEGPEKQSTPMAELVFVTIEQEYKPQLAKPLIEGGQPQFGLAKIPVTKTIRFTADKGALQMLLVTVSGILGDMGVSEGELEGDHEIVGQPVTGPSVIVTG